MREWRHPPSTKVPSGLPEMTDNMRVFTPKLYDTQAKMEMYEGGYQVQKSSAPCQKMKGEPNKLIRREISVMIATNLGCIFQKVLVPCTQYGL